MQAVSKHSIEKTVTNAPVTIQLPQSAPEQAIEGISEVQAKAYIYEHESSNSLTAVNESSGACGLGQSLPCDKMATVCPNWQNDYECQDKWFTQYVNNRYGSWAQAYQFWQSHNWY